MRQGQQHRRGRSRHNNNNNNNQQHRKNQNPLTRSFESNGPDVKVRGTPAHVAEKYIQLARDAQSAGDPVLAENYLQHAEHYNRIILAYREQVQHQGGGDGMNGGGHPRGRGFEPAEHDDFGSDDEAGVDDIGQGEQPTITRFPHEMQGSMQRHGEQGRGEQGRGDPGQDHQQAQHGHQGQMRRNEQHGRFRDRYERHDRQDRQLDRPERHGDRQFDRPERNGEHRDRQERHGDRFEPQQGERQPNDRQHGDRQHGDRPHGDRPHSDRQHSDRQPNDRQHGDRQHRHDRFAERQQRFAERRERQHQERQDRQQFQPFQPHAQPPSERFSEPPPAPERPMAPERGFGGEERSFEPAPPPPVPRERPVEAEAASSAPDAPPVAPTETAAPERRRRERFPAGDQPEFLRRPVRRRREAEAPPAAATPTGDDEPSRE